MHTLFHHLGRVAIRPQNQHRTMAAASAAGGSATGGGGDGSLQNDSQRNRLAKEKSPYLLQHATNPVNWYPWGDEAFKAATEQNKLIFLSVGYSTCHWCHVMERESFENPKVAEVMNKHFINVKVDREERPDVDGVYMTFVTSMSGSGGWPMSVWLTPDLHPVYGGTYFPPNNRYFGRPGFTTLLEALAKQWTNDEAKVRSSGSAIVSVLKKSSALPKPDDEDDDSSAPAPGESSAKCLAQLARSYEPDYGGFSEAPKFPQPCNLNFLFTYYLLHPQQDDANKGKDMALHTLTMMARGGIHDHVAQGFARYSTDKTWHVPHFEKMLYDQAQLVHAYLDAFLVSGTQLYAEVVRDILEYVMRDLSHESGGFYSAEDADSLPTATSTEKKEGAFCVWTYEEVQRLLPGRAVESNSSSDAPSLADLFCHHYSVVDGGNVDPQKDPHDELKQQNVLMEHGSVEDTAQEIQLSVSEVRAALASARRTLYDYRSKRPRPHLDDKMVTAWNGMMLSAMSRAGAVLAEPKYVARARQAAAFLEKYLTVTNSGTETAGAAGSDAGSGDEKPDVAAAGAGGGGAGGGGGKKLFRAAYRGDQGEVTLGPHPTDGFCDDYAWAVRGLLSLYEATLDQRYLLDALSLQHTQDHLFWDHSHGGYYSTQGDDPSILIRIKDDHDGAEPSVNSVSAGNLLKLSRLLEQPELLKKCRAVMRLFADRLSKIPIALPEMAAVQLMLEERTSQVILSGDPESSVMKELVTVVHRFPHPNRVLLVAPPDAQAPLYAYHSSLQNYRPKSTTPCSTSTGASASPAGGGEQPCSQDPASDSSQILESAKAFVCHNFVCSLPMTKPEQLRKNLEKTFQAAMAAAESS